jgi:chromosome segregation ATPase
MSEDDKYNKEDVCHSDESVEYLKEKITALTAKVKELEKEKGRMEKFEKGEDEKDKINAEEALIYFKDSGKERLGNVRKKVYLAYSVDEKIADLERQLRDATENIESYECALRLNRESLEEKDAEISRLKEELANRRKTMKPDELWAEDEVIRLKGRVEELEEAKKLFEQGWNEEKVTRIKAEQALQLDTEMLESKLRETMIGKADWVSRCIKAEDKLAALKENVPMDLDNGLCECNSHLRCPRLMMLKAIEGKA